MNELKTKEKEYEFKGDWIYQSEYNYGNEDHLYYRGHRHAIVKKKFCMDTLQEYTLKVACLGYYIGYLNGHRIGDYELNSDWTNYQACVYYDTYNVTKYLVKGENELLFELGNGMYNPAPLRLFGKYNLRARLHEIGEPRLLCDLINSDHNVIVSTNESWLVGEGNLLYNNLYLGEIVDYRKHEPHWRSALVTKKKYTMRKSEIPKIKTFQKVYPTNTTAYNNGLLFDFGEMISGFINLQVEAKDSQQVLMQYSECFQNNILDFSSSLAGSVGEWMGDRVIDGGSGAPKEAIQCDEIICAKGINTFRNRFTYHSFRYLYLTGCNIEDIKEVYALYVHTDLKQIGTVTTDHSNYNLLWEVATRTKLNNVHSTFEDCARERLGYGGDMVALAMSNLFQFDLESFYKKILYDFRLEQTLAGGIPETAPYIGIQSNGTGDREGPLLWQFMYPYITYRHYQFYGDKPLLENEYPYLKKQMEYLLHQPLDTLAQCCLGDHGSMLIQGNFRRTTPDKEFLGYCAILLFLKYNILIAKAIQEDTIVYEQKFDAIKRITIEKFKTENGFGEESQSSFAFALLLELIDPRVLCENFIRKIKEDNGVFTSGIFGMAFTYEGLHKYGYNHIIEEWLLQKSEISFHQMLKNGNKALAELFIGEHSSLNHAMFASYPQWFFQGLAGIQIEEDAIAFSKITLQPYFSKYTNKVDCEVFSKQGMIKSSWERIHNEIIWRISIPPSIQYQILPQKTLKLKETWKEYNEIVQIYAEHE